MINADIVISVFRSRERDEAEGILVIFYTKNVAVDQMLLERKLETGNGDRDSSKPAKSNNKE